MLSRAYTHIGRTNLARYGSMEEEVLSSGVQTRGNCETGVGSALLQMSYTVRTKIGRRIGIGEKMQNRVNIHGPVRMWLATAGR